MIDKELSKHILTIGPDPNALGGIAQVLHSYFTEVFEEPKYIRETLPGPKIRKLMCMAGAFASLTYRLATDKDIKIVHMHTATKVSFPRSAMFGRIAKMFGKKTIMHVHGSNFDDYYRRKTALVTKTLSQCDMVVALSGTWNDFFRNEVHINHVTTIPNIFSSPKSVIKPSTDKVHGLFLGLLGDRKGIFDLLEALKRIAQQISGRFVLHVGGNGEVEKFKKAVVDLGLSDIVEFHGWVKADEKESLLNLSRIYILPSYGEGLPISILEAMAHGNAVISTNVGGIPEVVDDGNGKIITPGDIDTLASTILDMVNSPERLEAMGKESMKRISANTSENVAKELEKMYRAML